MFVDMAAKQTRLGSANISWAAFTSAKQEHGLRDINLHGFKSVVAKLLTVENEKRNIFADVRKKADGVSVKE